MRLRHIVWTIAKWTFFLELFLLAHFLLIIWMTADDASPGCNFGQGKFPGIVCSGFPSADTIGDILTALWRVDFVIILLFSELIAEGHLLDLAIHRPIAAALALMLAIWLISGPAWFLRWMASRVARA